MGTYSVGEGIFSFLFTKQNDCQSSSDRLIFLLSYIKKHFLKEGIVTDFQIKCIRTDISETLEARNYGVMWVYSRLWWRGPGIAQMRNPADLILFVVLTSSLTFRSQTHIYYVYQLSFPFHFTLSDGNVSIVISEIEENKW